MLLGTVLCSIGVRLTLVSIIGNFYSIANETNTTAKIFFAQGCEMAPEPPDPIDAAALEQ